MTVARSSYIAGFAGTSNVLAGKVWGIPVSGTMAHSFVTAFESEVAAFEAYADLFPDSAVFLIDTYDTIAGARNAAAMGLRMKQKGHALMGVRLDSGDMVALSRQVRSILDEAGLPEVKIFASSGFDEYELERLIAEGNKVVVVTNDPYAEGAPATAGTVLNCWSLMGESLKEAAEVLYGKKRAAGTMPVNNFQAYGTPAGKKEELVPV